jgi:hypothetical protein
MIKPSVGVGVGSSPPAEADVPISGGWSARGSVRTEGNGWTAADAHCVERSVDAIAIRQGLDKAGASLRRNRTCMQKASGSSTPARNASAR